jgi:hypothetical protein
MSYISILIAQAVSARRASKMLDALEAIRIGDPASSLERAVPQCTLGQLEKGYSCGILAVGGWYWQGVLAHIPSEYYLPVIWRLRRLGVQPWYITVDASIPDGRIRSLRLNAFVIAGRKSLGAAWELNENMPQRFIEESSTSADLMRTYIGDYSITSLPGGKGISIAATPDSDRRELQHVTSISPVYDHLTDVRSCANYCPMPYPFLMIAAGIGLTAPQVFTNRLRGKPTSQS